jgi:hypothetical protein
MVSIVHGQGGEERIDTRPDACHRRAITMIALHKNARTTPAIRDEIASSTASAASLAQRFGVSEATVYK